MAVRPGPVILNVHHFSIGRRCYKMMGSTDGDVLIGVYMCFICVRVTFTKALTERREVDCH